jgi:hypothetical protein
MAQPIITADQAKVGDVIEMVDNGHLSGRYYRISKYDNIIGRIAVWDATATKVKVHHTCKCVVVPPHEVPDHLKKVWGMN